jgi:tight adherence protein B
MMHLLLALLLIGGLLVFAMARRGRAAELTRLEGMLGARAAGMAPNPATAAIERFLPSSLVRSLHILGIELRPREIVPALAFSALAALIVAMLFGPLYALGIIAAFLLTGLGVLHFIADRRTGEIGALVPGFLDRVRQLLSVGNSLPVAFTRAVQGAQPRLAAFFAPALRRMNNGASFPDTIHQSANDIDLYEMRLFAAAVTVNTRFGGSLTHSLNNLVLYLRKRASIERELRASTTQIRASAWVLALLPVGVAAMILMQNREYAAWFLSHPTGRWMLGYCILSQATGVIFMRMIVRTKF